jgi:hypothetical protein
MTTTTPPTTTVTVICGSCGYSRVQERLPLFTRSDTSAAQMKCTGCGDTWISITGRRPLSVGHVAKILQVTAPSVSRTLRRARVRRRAGTSYEGDFPEPDSDETSRSPWWWPETIAAYLTPAAVYARRHRGTDHRYQDKEVTPS